MNKPTNETLWQIAKTCEPLYRRGDLELHYNDDEDVITMSLGEAEQLIIAAYEAGRRSKP